MIVRRLVLVLSIVVCGSLAMAAAVFGAGGGLGPGQTLFSDTNANAFFGGKGGPPEGFTVFVNQGLNSFEPEDGGVTTVNRSTIVKLAVFTASGSGGACYVIPDSDFVVSRNLQSATLNTTLTTENMCKGKGTPTISSAPSLSTNGVLPSVINLPPSITINVTWNGTGVTSVLRSKSTFECLDYSTDKSSTSRAAAAGATGSISMLTGSLTASSAVVGSTDGTIDVSGVLSSACPFLGFGG
jgi:hypothetical protein